MPGSAGRWLSEAAQTRSQCPAGCQAARQQGAAATVSVRKLFVLQDSSCCQGLYMMLACLPVLARALRLSTIPSTTLFLW